jgi:hypothetical protein
VAQDNIHVYETPIGRLFVGVPKGESRPAVWCELIPLGQPQRLGRLDGPVQMAALVTVLDTAFDQIQETINHYKQLNGDSNK